MSTSNPRGLLLALASVLIPIVAGCASTTPRRAISSSSIETGVASYYHDSLHGNTTASGDVYDREALTAAHRSLPFGTTVLVRNLDNGRSARLTINDRGPFVEGRILDVSHRAAQVLGFLDAGLARVSLEIVEAARGGR